jgi:hypothetical protein
MPSAVIDAYDYNVDTETLTVRYRSGKVYNYLQVPEKVYKEMRATTAKGIFLNKNIKRKYPFVEIEP